nr:unnamed protein product [Callosobruchus analis]
MGPNVEVCSTCDENFLVNSKHVTCSCCLQKFHAICVSVKDSWLKVHSKKLCSFCDSCQFKWQEVAILRNQLQSLKREKELVETLNHELTYSNHLQKTIIKKHEEDIDTLKKSNPLPSSSLRNPTYSDIIKKKPANQDAVLLIQSNSNKNNNDILNDVTTLIKPAELKICVNNTMKIKDGIAVHCDNDISLSKLKERMVNTLGPNYKIREATKVNPRMLVKNIRLENMNSSDDIINDIVTLNEIEGRRSEIKCITHLKHFNSNNIVIEVSPALRNQLIAKQYIHTSWKRCEIVDHFRIIKCFKCCSFGQVEKNCKSDRICPSCAENHKLSDCKSELLKCINCSSYNKMYKRNLQTDHSGIYKDCPMFLNYVSNLKDRINYI